MHVVTVLHTWFARACPEVHAGRGRAVFAGVAGLLRGQRLWLTAIGRHMNGRETTEKHGVKRADRLLGNGALRADRSRFYRWMARRWIAPKSEPVLLIDWSDLNPERTLFVLRAALPIGGRALPVYEEVHAKENGRAVRERFLERLGALLPAGCRPILVSDAGFRRPWFEAVARRGWYYVGRVRNREFVQPAGASSWQPVKALYAEARATPEALGEYGLVRRAPFRTALYRFQERARGRKHRTCHGQPSRAAHSRKAAAGAREPWLLASNLPSGDHAARRVVGLYRLRMQIEQGFRDLKAPRHGFAFRENLGRDRERVANLLLLAALGVFATHLLGLVGQARGLVRGLQANTERRRPVLSLFFIGTRLIRQGLRAPPRELREALARLRELGHHGDLIPT